MVLKKNHQPWPQIACSALTTASFSRGSHASGVAATSRLQDLQNVGVFSVVPKKNEHPQKYPKVMDLSFNSTRNFSLFQQKTKQTNTKVWLFPGASASLLLASALDSGEKKNPKVGFNLPRVFPFFSHHFSLLKTRENSSTPSAGPGLFALSS